MKEWTSTSNCSTEPPEGEGCTEIELEWESYRTSGEECPLPASRLDAHDLVRLRQHATAEHRQFPTMLRTLLVSRQTRGEISVDVIRLSVDTITTSEQSITIAAASL